jgi:lipoprotein signal peptidase
MGFISDLKELSAWIIGIASLVILYIFIYTRLKKEKIKT